MYNYYGKTTFSDELIAFLLSARSTSLRHKILWERIQKRKNININTYHQNIYRLKKKGLIKIENNEVQLIRNNYNKYIKYKLICNYPAKTNKIILIFDIPEKDRKIRDWLRKQIKMWGFTMIQKSVWLGTGPLPKEFYGKTKLLGIEKFIKIYNVRSSKDLKN